MRRLIYLLGANFLISSAWGLSELTIQVGHQKQVYGKDRQSDIVTKNHYWGTAFYFFKAYTALDFYYAHQLQTDNGRDLNIRSENNGGLVIDSSRTRIKTQSYGVGIKQAFTDKNALIRPTLSVGHARQVVQSSKNFVLRDNDGNTHQYSLLPKKYRYSSIFATLAIQLKIIPGVAIQISTQTIFKAFEFDQIDENLKYLIGLTWIL